jgi:alkaline phosphatase isozyme conversion protein
MANHHTVAFIAGIYARTRHATWRPSKLIRTSGHDTTFGSNTVLHIRKFWSSLISQRSNTTGEGILMADIRRLRFTAVIILATLFAGLLPISAASKSIDFNAENALRHATYLSETIGERTAASAAEQRSVAWLASELFSLGYTVEVQPFGFSRGGEDLIGMNVVAVKEGLPNYGTIYVGAHHDTAHEPFNGPGANDNASGIAVMLEAAEVLVQSEMTPTVKFIAFGAEELQMIGSGRFVAQLPPEERMTAIGMLNLDCVGIGDELHVSVLYADHLDFAKKLGVDADNIGVDSQRSDHVPFATDDIPAAFFNMRDPDGHVCGPNYHSKSDTVDTLEKEAIQRVGSNLVIAIENLGRESAPRPIWRSYIPMAAN